MDIKLANLLCTMLENNGEECNVREDYSGRGMYGNETAAITCDCGFATILSIVLEAVKDGWLTEDDLSDIKRFGMRQDSMGLGIVIY